jgi:type III restriction enzyme
MHQEAHMTRPATANIAIRNTPGVSGGNACVRDTRIAVWTLWRLRTLGRSDAELLEDYPTLTPQDLAAAWQYALENPDEVREAAERQGRPPRAKA